MKIEDVKLDQVVWQCVLNAKGDPELRKGIITPGRVEKESLEVTTLGVTKNGRYRRLHYACQSPEEWWATIEAAVYQTRARYNKIASGTNAALDKLCESLGKYENHH